MAVIYIPRLYSHKQVTVAEEMLRISGKKEIPSETKSTRSIGWNRFDLVDEFEEPKTDVVSDNLCDICEYQSAIFSWKNGMSLCQYCEQIHYHCDLCNGCHQCGDDCPDLDIPPSNLDAICNDCGTDLREDEVVRVANIPFCAYCWNNGNNG